MPIPWGFWTQHLTMASGDRIGPLGRPTSTPRSTAGASYRMWNTRGGGSAGRPGSQSGWSGKDGWDSEHGNQDVYKTVLPLLHARVLARTAEALDLDPQIQHVPEVEVVDPSSCTPDVFLGRLLAAQHGLAQLSPFPEPRRSKRLQRGMVEGVAETLELLSDAQALNPSAWQVIAELLGAFEQKLLRLLHPQGNGES